MDKATFREAYRQARLFVGFMLETGVPLDSFFSLPNAAQSCVLYRSVGDVLDGGYGGTGHRCGRRRPRWVAGPKGFLPR